MVQRLQTAFFLAIALGPCAAGCRQGPPPLVPVSGTVAVDGQPLAEGFMYFKTIATGQLERVDIKGGKFEGKAHLGARRVEIYANRPKRVIIDEKEVEVPENYIDPAFNTDSTLNAEVTLEGPNRFTFDVKKK